MSQICPDVSFGQDQLVVAREAQSIFLAGMLDDDFAAAREQSAAVDPLVSGVRAKLRLERLIAHRDIPKRALEHFEISCLAVIE
jgi:hypothetical protein